MVSSGEGGGLNTYKDRVNDGTQYAAADIVERDKRNCKVIEVRK